MNGSKFERTGGLVLCSCGHPKSFHYHRAKWYGGPLHDEKHCGLCPCEKYEQGEDQGLHMRQK